MIDLHRDVLELFAEAQRLGTRRSGWHWHDLGRDERERATFVPAAPVAPFERTETEAVLLVPREQRLVCRQRGRQRRQSPAVVERPVYVVVALPHIRFPCPRGCGAMIRQNAGVPKNRAMSSHSCPNAVGHVAARRTG